MSSKHNDFLKIYSEKLKYFGYSKRTVEVYCHYVYQFIIRVDKYHQHLTSNDFQSYLDGYKFSSRSQQNQIISSIKFLYEKVLRKTYKKIDFTRPREEKKLPRVIDKTFLLNRISNIQNLKHKAIISLAYSVGLRVSEVINLKIRDIDSKRMVINVINAKGKKDRIVPLSINILMILRSYVRHYRPEEYLFNGQRSLKYSSTSCNKIVKKHIGVEYHFHLLRHSSFTSMIESGTDLRTIQSIAGHSSSKTTEIYTHVSNQMLKNANLPL